MYSYLDKDWDSYSARLLNLDTTNLELLSYQIYSDTWHDKILVKRAAES